jgi:hypothetical protein
MNLEQHPKYWNTHSSSSFKFHKTGRHCILGNIYIEKRIQFSLIFTILQFRISQNNLEKSRTFITKYRSHKICMLSRNHGRRGTVSSPAGILNVSSVLLISTIYFR